MIKKTVLKHLIGVIPNKKVREKLKTKYNLKNPTYWHYADRYISSILEGNDVILKELQKNQPCLIARFGSTELKLVSYFLKNIQKPVIHFPKKEAEMMRFSSGFFPINDRLLTRFSCEFLNLVPNIDVLGCWNFYTEDECQIVETYNKTAQLIHFSAIGDEVFFHDNPWTQYLKGKKVLVIHPFAKTIQAQYKKRKKLFSNELILPEFNLITLKAVQGLAGSDCEQFSTWFDALESMCREIDKIDFDIALIGAGAFGIFLGDYVKRKGKQAVHIGGATQLLFGILGERWEKQYQGYEKIFNASWTRPLPEETPQNLSRFTKTERFKAYW